MPRVIVVSHLSGAPSDGLLAKLGHLNQAFKSQAPVIFDAEEDGEWAELERIAGVDLSEVASVIAYESEFYRDEGEKKRILARLRTQHPNAFFI